MDLSSNGNVLYVGGGGPGNYSTIQGAIDDVESGWGYLEVIMPVNQQISQQSSNPLFFQILQRLMNIR